MQVELQTIYLPNISIMMLDLPPEPLQYLDKLCADIQHNPKDYTPWNPNLAGHLQDQYRFAPSAEFKNFIEAVATQYDKQLLNCEVELTSCWANFQRRYEYNPSHTHDGVLSFVIWLEIPYDLEQELAVYKDARGQRASCFEFKYTSVLGQISTHTLPIDRTWRGRMCMFPAKLIHQVNPFTTVDGVRISVSGNLEAVYREEK